MVGFQALVKHLGGDQPVYGLQSLGLDGKTATPKSVKKMAEHYINEIISVYPKGPYNLAGMSFGGAVAYEMAQQLHARGYQAGLLALFDSYPKGESELLPLTEKFDQEINFWKRRLEGHWRELRALRATDVPAYVRRKVRTLRRRFKSQIWRIALRLHGWIIGPTDLPPILHDVRESNAMAARNYVSQPYPGKVVLFMASESISSNKQLLRTDWDRLALGGMEVLEVPGDHVTMIEEPHVPVLAGQLRACLDALPGRIAG